MKLEIELTQLQNQLIEMLYPENGPLESSNVVEKILRFQELLGSFHLHIQTKYRGLQLSPHHSKKFRISYEDQDPSPEMVRELSQLQEWRNFVQNYHSELDKAILQERRDELTKRKDKKYADIRTPELEIESFIGSNKKDANSQSANAEEKLLSADKAITSNLIISNNVLKSSVLQSSLNFENLTEQTGFLSGLSVKSEHLSLILQKSNKIVKIIESSSGHEKRQIYMALSFLGACITWIIWHRLLRGPFRLLFWIWFKSFRFLLVTTGFIKNSGISLLAPQELKKNLTTETQNVISLNLSNHYRVSQAVDEAFTRIIDGL